MKCQAEWEIHLNGKHLDTVFFDNNCDRHYVYDSLVNHDNFSPNIKIYKVS